jgi:hypothetical protein
MAVTDLIFSLRTSMDGSGPDLVPKSDPQINVILGIGVTPEATVHHNLTIARQLRYIVILAPY